MRSVRFGHSAEINEWLTLSQVAPITLKQFLRRQVRRALELIGCHAVAFGDRIGSLGLEVHGQRAERIALGLCCLGCAL